MLLFVLIFAYECFAVKLPLRIYGGIDAMSEKYPHVVRMEIQTSYNLTKSTNIVRHRHSCTASALSQVWLISAAHCLNKEYPIIRRGPPNIIVKMVIRYGDVEDSPWMKDLFSEVINTVMHPSYMKNTIGSSVKVSRNDIGLLKTSPMNIRSYMKISAVDYQALYGHKATVGGFGLTRKKDADGKFVTNNTLFLKKPLQILKVMVSKCGHEKGLIPALCLTPRCTERTSVCPGDSGGPVIHSTGLIGVVSLAHSKCLNGIGSISKVAIVTPVSPYIEWIYSYVNA